MKNRTIIILILTVSVILMAGLTLKNNISDDNSLELHTIMRLLMLDIHTINEGIYTHNFDLIETGSEAINSHSPLSDESRSMVKNKLGDRMPAFGAFDNRVHAYADSIRDAALNQDMERVLQHYRIMEKGCVDCHTAFQSEIRLERLKSK